MQITFQMQLSRNKLVALSGNGFSSDQLKTYTFFLQVLQKKGLNNFNRIKQKHEPTI